MKKAMAFFLLYFLFQLNLPVHSQQLVLPGDYPDPSVIKVGDTYWASATTSNWSPVFPILKSKDLIKWETVNHVFTKIPAWADYYFWAPELDYDKGKYYIYYSAHKKDGNLCVAVASADKPEGPYKDHGPLICQEVGSIDAFPIRDENGRLYIIWKEDGNSVGKSTSIWIAEMNEERTALIGEKKELFRNDASWEANLVEGVAIVRKGGYYFAFYSAAGCCGAACTYGVGVARSKSLFGPWEKYEKNPILISDDQWKCPGHGTPVEKDGRHYFLYHGYDPKSNVITGRQGLLMEYRFTDNGWVEFIRNTEEVTYRSENVNEEFNSAALSPQWQWSVFDKPSFLLSNGKLMLQAPTSGASALLGHKIISANYMATTAIDARKSNAVPGIAVIGDENNRVIAKYQNNHIDVVITRNATDSLIARVPFKASNKLYLRVDGDEKGDLKFYGSRDGNNFLPVGTVSSVGATLAPWDRAIRVGIISGGNKGVSVFENFSINYSDIR